MKNRQTDNSNLAAKIAIRQDAIDGRQDVRVLDCYAGYGKCWRQIQKNNMDKNIVVLGIDKKKIKGNLKGDNIKYLLGMDLNRYDIIDLDAYGVPIKQLKIALAKCKNGQTIIVTFIQSIFGALPHEMLLE